MWPQIPRNITLYVSLDNEGYGNQMGGVTVTRRVGLQSTSGRGYMDQVGGVILVGGVTVTTWKGLQKPDGQDYSIQVGGSTLTRRVGLQ